MSSPLAIASVTAVLKNLLDKGVSDFVTNTVGGVLHLVTFPITGLDVPLPDNGVQL